MRGEVRRKGCRAALALCLGLVVALGAGAPAQADASGPLLLVAPPGQVAQDGARQTCRLCRTLDQQIRQGCARPADVPYADVIYLRRGINPPVSDTLRQAIAQAQAGGDPDFAARVLTPHLSASLPEARYAAGVFLALSLTQAGRPLMSRVGRAALTAMRSAAPSLEMPASDLAYFQALLALEKGRKTAALAAAKRALIAEPRFFAAIVLALELQIDRAVRVEGQGLGLCRQVYDAILTLTAAAVDLAPCAQHAAHLESYLSRGQSRPDLVSAIWAIKVYLARIARRDQLARHAAQRFEAIEGPLCRDDVIWQLRALSGGVSHASEERSVEGRRKP